MRVQYVVRCSLKVLGRTHGFGSATFSFLLDTWHKDWQAYPHHREWHMSFSSRFTNATEPSLKGDGEGEVKVDGRPDDMQPTATNNLISGVPNPLSFLGVPGTNDDGIPVLVQDAPTADFGSRPTAADSSLSFSQDFVTVAEPDVVEEGLLQSLGIGFDDGSVYIGTVSPIVPEERTVAEENPKSALKEYYDKSDPRIILTKGSFVSITDTAAGHHVPLFSSIFVCPMTGEIFLSGRLLNPKYGGDQVIVRNNLAWYKTKANSHFAAAGRALDCFNMRGERKVEEKFCDDAPYRSTDYVVTTDYLEEHYLVPRSEIRKVKDLEEKAYRNNN